MLEGDGSVSLDGKRDMEIMQVAGRSSNATLPHFPSREALINCGRFKHNLKVLKGLRHPMNPLVIYSQKKANRMPRPPRKNPNLVEVC